MMLLRQRIRTLPKWGNDDERVDRWAGKLLACRERALSKVDAEFGDPPHMVCHVVRSLHHVNGRQMPATPDGRRAGQPLADSIGAELGTAKAGPTAILNSVLKIDASACYKGGYNLNLTLPPTHPAQIEALVTGFFEQGGQELQINSFDATTLRDAQRKPENYGDLLVRIAGLSARFVDLSVAGTRGTHTSRRSRGLTRRSRGLTQGFGFALKAVCNGTIWEGIDEHSCNNPRHIFD